MLMAHHISYSQIFNGIGKLMKFIYQIEKKVTWTSAGLSILINKEQVNFTVDCGTLSLEAIDFAFKVMAL